MPKSVALKSLEQILSSVDEQILPAEDRESILDIIGKSQEKKPIDEKREEHYTLLADLCAFHTTYKLKLVLLEIELKKQAERVSAKFQAATGKAPAEHRIPALVADDTTGEFYLTLVGHVNAICGGLKNYIDSFKQRGQAIYEESIDSRHDRKLATTDY